MALESASESEAELESELESWARVRGVRVVRRRVRGVLRCIFVVRCGGGRVDRWKKMYRGRCWRVAALYQGDRMS
jgi:hypothetical protein